tara:strand:- start:102 stop:488 length:387 start_codon:yes stop_codon:yes gene_type:complete
MSSGIGWFRPVGGAGIGANGGGRGVGDAIACGGANGAGGVIGEGGLIAGGGGMTAGGAIFGIGAEGSDEGTGSSGTTEIVGGPLDCGSSCTGNCSFSTVCSVVATGPSGCSEISTGIWTGLLAGSIGI